MLPPPLDPGANTTAKARVVSEKKKFSKSSKSRATMFPRSRMVRDISVKAHYIFTVASNFKRVFVLNEILIYERLLINQQPVKK